MRNPCVKHCGGILKLVGKRILRGILCIWSEKTFKLERKVIGNGFIMLVGQWLKEAQQVHVISIYTPFDI